VVTSLRYRSSTANTISASSENEALGLMPEDGDYDNGGKYYDLITQLITVANS
jgi:hypothetical protein